ncbi:MAG TPA: phosphotransferase [Pseudonocardiaceae bacterium]|nr:phosphotransferase [Pseudonocardiaceae bacterium]
MSDVPSAERVLTVAAGIAGLDSRGAELIRDGSNVMYQLAGQIVARIGKPGSRDTAEREVSVSRWLNDAGVRATRALPDVDQPVMVDGRPVTWWQTLPAHRAATPSELGEALRTLHALSLPSDLALPHFDPFDRLDQQLAQAHGADRDDLTWLAVRLAALRHQYDGLHIGQPSHVIHGDAWQGNVAVSGSGTSTLLDLEHVSIGHRQWDLVPLAVDYVDFARLTADDYRAFVRSYGHDVTGEPEFRLLADIQELRWVGFVLSKAGVNPAASREARHRVACLCGDVPKPWTWAAF